jgi:phosphoribosylformylglycinamidine synthase
MKYLAQINIMPLKALLDPQGKAVLNNAKKTGFDDIANIRIGKHIDVEIDTESKDRAVEKIDELCQKILTNPIIESYEFTIYEL